MKKILSPGAKLQQSMTEGPIWKGLIYFAIPIFFGNLFQCGLFGISYFLQFVR